MAADLRQQLRLIVVADVEGASGRDLVEIIRASLQGGAPAVQLRAKTSSGREMTRLAEALRQHTRATGALIFVNDRVDVALAAGADGAHIGDDDLPLTAARRIAPPEFLLGRSVDTVEGAIRAEAEGADYLGAGPVYSTTSKADAGAPVGVDQVSRIASAVKMPVVGIGGIDATNAAAVFRAGAAGVAVIRAVLGAADPRAATQELLRTATLPA